MADLLTQAAYARQRGCSPPYIHKLVKAGIIKLKKGKVSSKQANRAIAEYADASRDDGKKDSGPEATQGPAKGSIADFRSKELQIKVALKNLEYKEKMGLLVRQSDEKEKGFVAAANLKDSFFNLFERLAPVLVAEKSAVKIRKMLMKEANKIFKELSDGDGG